MATSQYNRTLITSTFDSAIAAGLASFFSDAAAYFYVASGNSAWDSTPSEIPLIGSSISSKRAIWDSMSGISKITGRDVRLGFKRNDWTSGTSYSKYDEDVSADITVLAGTTDRDVYKCLDNNGNSPSTSKPVHTNIGISREKELDGYVWKYMFTIPDIEFYEFATDSYLPVSQSSGSVQRFAVDGSILNATIPANNTIGTGELYRGSGFSNGTPGVGVADMYFVGIKEGNPVGPSQGIKEVNTFETLNATTFPSGTKTNIVLASNTPVGFVYGDAPSHQWHEWGYEGLAGWSPSEIPSYPGYQNEWYSNSVLYVTSGLSAGQYRTIVGNEAMRSGYTSPVFAHQFTLDSPLETMAPGDKVMIGPKIEIAGDKGGSGFVGFGEVNGKGNLVSVSVLSSGRNYTNVSGTMAATVNGAYLIAPHGSGAIVDAYTSPLGGHGKSPITELNAKYLIISARTPRAISDNYGNGQYVGPDGTIRQIGIIMGGESSDGVPAASPSYDSRTTMYFAHPVATMGPGQDFKKDATITNANTGATATIWSIDGSSGEQYITVTDVHGDFTQGDVLSSGSTNIKISSANLASYTYPSGTTITPNEAVMYNGVVKYSGDIVYHEIISPSVSRSDSQIENFKIVFEL